MKGYRNILEALRAIFADGKPHTLDDVLQTLRRVGFKSKAQDIPAYVRGMILTTGNGNGGQAFEVIGANVFRAVPAARSVIRNRDRSLDKLQLAIEEMRLDGPDVREVVLRRPHPEGGFDIRLRCGHEIRRRSKVFSSTHVLCGECKAARLGHNGDLP